MHLAQQSLVALGEASSVSWHPVRSGTVLGGRLQQRKAAVSGEGAPAGVPSSSQRRSPIHSPGRLPARAAPRCPGAAAAAPTAVRGAEAGPAAGGKVPCGARSGGEGGGGQGWHGNKQRCGVCTEAASPSRRGRRRGFGHGDSGAPGSLQPRLSEPCVAAPSPLRFSGPSPPPFTTRRKFGLWYLSLHLWYRTWPGTGGGGRGRGTGE